MSGKWFTAGFLIWVTLIPVSSFAQLERNLANPDRAVDDIFKAPKIIGLNSVKQIGKNHLHMSILHTFNGSVSGGIETFFGIDNGANVRLGLDYGISDDVSVGLGRTSNLKVVDMRVKWTPIQQTTQSSPVSVAFMGAASIETIPNRFSVDPKVSDKMGYSAMVMLARKMNEKLSLQASPMIAYFQRPVLLKEKALVGLGIAGRYKMSDRTALTFETIPILDKPETLSLPVALGIDLETGGHVFQMFFTTSTFHTESYIMSYNVDPFWDRKPLFRFGFNVNRIFAL